MTTQKKDICCPQFYSCSLLANLVLCTARWRDGCSWEASSTDIAQLNGIAAIIQLLIRRLKWQSEVGNVLVWLFIVHSLHISDTFDLPREGEKE